MIQSLYFNLLLLNSYKKLMKAYHPDRHQADPKKQRWAVEQSQKVNEAYAFLEKKLDK